MTFDDVLAGIPLLDRGGQNPLLRGMEYDSRRIPPGGLFVAMQGETTDGNRYIPKALELGAAAILTDSAEAFAGLRRDHPETAAALIAHGRNALALASANFYAHPERALKLSGVTGTNGKTTTAFLLDAILNHAGRKTVLVGTIEYHVAGSVRPSPHTTPESRDLYELLREGVDAGASETVMEVSSHALEQGRVFAVPYDVAIFTNLTRDHLDFHGTMENYFAAKRRLFDGSLTEAPRVAVVNIDDPYGVRLGAAAREAGAQTYSYGLASGDFHASDVEMKPSGMRFTLHSPAGSIAIATRLTGQVNVYNLLAACAAAFARDLSLQQIQAGIASLECVPGRFQTVDRGQPFTVVVDYAHTDDALRNLTALARAFVTSSGGRVLTLFGCGGDRDCAKRPLMGRAAGEGSDFVILTSDNPRSEEPSAIIADALPGLEATGTTFAVEPDRAAAISLALREARAGDIVLLAGKGHEKTQTIGAHVIPFDDAAVAAAALETLQEEVRA
ncbi:UDP-N-acetylmuramoyl-L-alanyl-D-glutamate--2,6-diaminopimelate ligase [Silvibacterium dinghuense]|uniref:UDP-N-acetylmuramoyl-L-alanyl-D-glutamate--2,6-diaminopimelate ligase n=2 Tax=Silvibacterium dinghuense TaxID=1560006 RepID=A0A4Q1SCB6_9BACT|nr:UDP-N-acetylmuramoyl-L-alanyl-D-glutamate--2,6-diaminopimelate ligase [Silvibacterium dinghuense]RXS94627.1 UDP-N-acetylmuramoyl-L-alanyl-D-glutamate--2,6-diaminopimelate ligase [Silvibacterium dinghuense]GGH16995.1 UDP-N-acetylmuramoyl-L-alanyl-D-glutamate--2,6-diaminopimelate ligase [Silvibacterium dinghuense]